MEFRIATTFLESLQKLTNQEQKAVKTTVFDLQTNPANPGLNFHKLDGAKDSDFASVRVNRDIRLIVHRSQNSLLICYVAHHDNAYTWAQRRKIEIHPTTGAAQLVEIRETVQEIVTPATTSSKRPYPKLKGISESELMAYGVPPEWVADVLNATDDDALLEIAEHLPAEAAEALLDLAVGKQPVAAPVAAPTDNPFHHPDAERRFRIMSEAEDLEYALDYPWEKWTVFLHPRQQQIVDTDYSGPARVYGSAGTGKTVVALHRSVQLAKNNPESRVLLATFSDALANMLLEKLKILLHQQPRLKERIDVYAMDAMGERLYHLNLSQRLGKLELASDKVIADLLQQSAAAIPNHKFSLKFLCAEWDEIVDAWQIDSLEAYLNVPRLGRKTRLSENQRITLWSIFERVQAELKSKGLLTHAGMFAALAQHYASGVPSPFAFIVVDESQDINIAQLKFLAVLAGETPNGLFFAGDQGQRIFQQSFSWKALGVDVRGRSKSLRINYRTSHQIRTQADKLLDPELADVDGNAENRGGTVSVFNGPQPVIKTYGTKDDEIQAVADWITSQINAGAKPQEIGIIVRSEHELDRAKAALEASEQPFKTLDKRIATTVGYISLCTMHLAKGLEFRAVAVMACDSDVIPSNERIEMLTDEADFDEVFNTERRLLYVACTRARDELLVTAVKPGSEFLSDLLA